MTEFVRRLLPAEVHHLSVFTKSRCGKQLSLSCSPCDQARKPLAFSKHPAVQFASTWFASLDSNLERTEHTLVSKTNDSTLILLVLPKADRRHDEPEESSEDLLESTSERFRHMGQDVH